MDPALKALHARQIDETTAHWKRLARHSPPRRGWINAVRKALGMSTRQLASRLGVTRQAVLDLESRERVRRVTLAALSKAAEAMECDLVYAVVPRRPVKETLWNRARAIAAQRLGTVAHSMQLEDQAVASGEYDSQVDDLAARILRESPRDLWGE